MINLFVVHPTPLVASLLTTVLDNAGDFSVVARAHLIEDALSRLSQAAPHIMLVAASLPDDGAMRLTREVAQTHPDVKVLVIGVPKSKHVILQYVLAGASGYVLKEVPVEKLFANIRALNADKALVSPDIAAAFLEQLSELTRLSSQTTIQPEAYKDLTERELEVLHLIDEDLTNKQIADRLFIEVGTVKNHVHNILRKLDVKWREEAAAHLPYILDELGEDKE